jgi:hypothetical protein
MPAHIRAFGTIVAMLLVLLGQGVRAQDADETTDRKLIAALPTSRVRIESALAAVVRPAAPISAKFEMDEHGNISLSIYVASRGVNYARSQALIELSGSPQLSWSPVVGKLTSKGDIGDATDQRKLMAKTSLSLASVARRARADQPGIVFSIIPRNVMGRDQFVVLVLGPNQQIATLAYDLKSGARLR